MGADNMEIPQSVREYVTDGSVRRAVNELLRIPADGILDGLEWSELERFYRAQLAARQLESEWAIFGILAWQEIWGGSLSHWDELSPDQQNEGNFDAGLSISELRDTGDDSLWFGRVFTSGAWTFWGAISAIPGAGLALKVACAAGNRSVAFHELAQRVDGNENWISPPLSLSEDALDIGALRLFAKQAVETADRELAQPGKKPDLKSRPAL